MRLLEFAARVAVCWLTIAAIVGLAWSVCVTRCKARGRGDVTRVALYPPPVPKPTTPPFTQTVADASWFDGIPSDCLSDDAVHSLFDDMVAGFRVIEGTDQ